MGKWDKVMETWEVCMAEHEYCDLGCPYWNEISKGVTACDLLRRDTLELLRKLQKIREDYECGLILNYELPEMLWGED